MGVRTQYIVCMYAGADPGFVRRGGSRIEKGGGSILGLQPEKGGSKRGGGAILGPMLKSVRSDILTLILPVSPYRYNLCIIPRFGIHTQSFDSTCYSFLLSHIVIITIIWEWPHHYPYQSLLPCHKSWQHLSDT